MISRRLPFLAFAVLLATSACGSGGGAQAGAAPSSSPTASPSVSSSPLPAALRSALADIQGVIYTPDQTRNHKDGTLTYPHAADTPPDGGDHNQTPQTCAVYDVPIRNEHAVHSLEHGAAWITYNPDKVSPTDVVTLANLVNNNPFRMLSPYPHLRTAISVQAWGVQLFASDASDPRLRAFVDAFTEGPTTPEPGAVCTGTSGTGLADDFTTQVVPDPTEAPTTAPVRAPGSCTYTRRGPVSKPVSGLPPTKDVARKTPYVATLSTDHGTITVDLLTSKAPCTVNSFRFLAEQRFFDATSCHRLTTSGIYVLQCGDPSGTGGGGPGYEFADENLTGATYPAGTLAMANAGPGTNGSQFFFVYQATQLPPSYTPFGRITSGLSILTAEAAKGSHPEGDGTPNDPFKLVKVSIRAGA